MQETLQLNISMWISPNKNEETCHANMNKWQKEIKNLLYRRNYENYIVDVKHPKKVHKNKKSYVAFEIIVDAVGLDGMDAEIRGLVEKDFVIH